MKNQLCSYFCGYRIKIRLEEIDVFKKIQVFNRNRLYVHLHGEDGDFWCTVFCTSIDKDIMNAVIMQIELEHDGGKDTAKDTAKFTDFKLVELNHPIFSYEFSSSHFVLKSSFVEHFKRYVDPYHPTVPTPPPNVI